MELLLINKADVRQYRSIDPNYDEEKFNGFLRDIQRRNLRDFLGHALYLDFMNSITVEKYIDLLNGKEYTYSDETIEYLGLKPILVYWWLAKASREGDNFIVNYGTVQFTDNPQEQFRSSRDKERIAQEHMQTAQNYANEAIRFLDTNYTTYSLWKRKAESKGVKFTMFKI